MRAGMAIVMTLLAASNALDAGELRKCVGADSGTSYVTGACPARTREVWARVVMPETESPALLQQQQKALQEWRREMRAEVAGQYGVQRSSRRYAMPASESQRAQQRCLTTKNTAASERESHWYRITFDRLRQLDENVAQACKR